MADLKLLEEFQATKPGFVNPITGALKQIECIRVDGASDEGPAHEEVQFLWTERHFQKASYATLITARNSGSSYLNRVELQNGCLALAHAWGGSCVDSATGKIDKEAYSALQVGCPCAKLNSDN